MELSHSFGDPWSPWSTTEEFELCETIEERKNTFNGLNLVNCAWYHGFFVPDVDSFFDSIEEDYYDYLHHFMLPLDRVARQQRSMEKAKNIRSPFFFQPASRDIVYEKPVYQKSRCDLSLPCNKKKGSSI